MSLTSAAPILPARDLAATLAFFERLGFRRLGGVYPDDLLVERDGVDALDADWARLGLPSQDIPRLIRAEDKPWGMRELPLIDPEGNLIRVGQPA